MHAQGVGLGGRRACPGGKKKNFEHGHVAYQIDGDDERNRIKVKFHPSGQTGDLGVRSKGQISSKFHYKVNFKYFYAKLYVCSHQ